MSVSSTRKTALDLARLRREIPDLSYDAPSKYSNVLHTNYVPTSSELDEIQSFSSSITSKTQEISTEIAQLEAQLARLKSREAFLNGAVAPFNALASPFRRFPPELMQYIFITCLPESRNAVMHASEAPILLGRVCSEWRRIALSTPLLWSTLHIVPPNFTADASELNTLRFQRKKEVVGAWLQRSGACPLSVSFVWLGTDGHEEVKLCSELLSLLVPLSKRWKRMEFQMPMRMCKPFIGLGKEDVPILEALNLTDNRSKFDDFDNYNLLTAAATIGGIGAGDGANGNGGGHAWPNCLEFAAHASELKSLNLTFFTGTVRIPSTIPWHQLTTLCLESNLSFFFRDCEDMLKTLEQCSALENCTLKLPLSVVSGLLPPQQFQMPTQYEPVDYVITLPELTYLCVDGDQHLFTSFHMTTTLANVRAPKLRELEIFGRTGRTEHFDGYDSDSDDESLGGAEGQAADVLPGTAGGLGEATSPGNRSGTTAASLSPEPFAGLKKLLKQSQCPLERLKLESITLVEKEFLTCMKLAPTIQDLVIRDYGARIGYASVDSNAKDGGDKLCAEDRILEALTVDRGFDTTAIPCSPPTPPPVTVDDIPTIATSHWEDADAMPPSPATSSSTIVEDSDELVSSSSISVVHTHGTFPDLESPAKRRSATQGPPLLPNLRSFEIAITAGSQELFCSFVESRFLTEDDWDDGPSDADSDISESESQVSSDSEDSEMPAMISASSASSYPPFLPIGYPLSMLHGLSPSRPGDTSAAKQSASSVPTLTLPNYGTGANIKVEIARLKSVKCKFTAEENPGVKERLRRMKKMGLQVGVSFHTASSLGEFMPSPWTGVEGL